MSRGAGGDIKSRGVGGDIMWSRGVGGDIISFLDICVDIRPSLCGCGDNIWLWAMVEDINWSRVIGGDIKDSRPLRLCDKICPLPMLGERLEDMTMS